MSVAWCNLVVIILRLRIVHVGVQFIAILAVDPDLVDVHIPQIVLGWGQ